MTEYDYVMKTAVISKEQDRWIEEQHPKLNFSALVRELLQAYIETQTKGK
jgi:hypothetical protein